MNLSQKSLFGMRLGGSDVGLAAPVPGLETNRGSGARSQFGRQGRVGWAADNGSTEEDRDALAPAQP